ncbi:MAG TPA: rhodanese-like domain-containing protein [Gemmatimonadales bacterium]|nr:rhodanese-like domain-containing protein [Gemmatimonadales bacterium]
MSYDLERAREHFQAKVDFTTGTHEVLGIIERGRNDVLIVDVRLPSDFRAGHIPGAVNLPKGRWENAKGLSKDKLHVLYCYSQTCHLAAEAAVELLKQGYRVQEMEGGYATWTAAGYPVEQEATQPAVAVA